MSNLVNLIILLVCVAYFALRGFKRGIWVTILGIAGLVLSYGACLLWGTGFAKIIEDMGLNPGVSMVAAFPLLFIAVSVAVNTLPPLVFPALKECDQKSQAAGAIVGAGVGTLVGIVAIWFVSFTGGVLQLHSSQDVARAESVENNNAGLGQAAESSAKPALERAANSMMGEVVAAGARVLGQDELRANTIAALIREPQGFSSGMQAVFNSPELAQFWHDGGAQQLMASNNIDALMEHGSFRNLVAVPGLQHIVAMSEPSLRDNPAKAERYIASQLSHVWRRMNYLQSNPQVQAILNDPEVRDLAQKRNPVSLLANEKVQQLMGIVMEDMPSVDEINENGGEDSAQLAEEETLKPLVIYKWQDDNGKTRYSDYENIPADKIDSAEIISHQ